MLNVIRVLINPYNQQKSKIQEEGKSLKKGGKREGKIKVKGEEKGERRNVRKRKCKGEEM